MQEQNEKLKESIGIANLKSTIQPVNSLRALNELIDILTDSETNSFRSYRTQESPFSMAQRIRIESIMNFLNSQIYGDMAKLDIYSEWNLLNELYDEYIKNQTNELLE